MAPQTTTPHKAREKSKAQRKTTTKPRAKSKAKPVAQKIIDRRIKTASQKALRKQKSSEKRNVDVVFAETYSWISRTDSYLETRQGGWVAMAIVLFFFGLVLAMVVVAFSDIYPTTEASSRREPSVLYGAEKSAPYPSADVGTGARGSWAEKK